MADWRDADELGLVGASVALSAAQTLHFATSRRWPRPPGASRAGWQASRGEKSRSELSPVKVRALKVGAETVSASARGPCVPRDRQPDRRSLRSAPSNRSRPGHRAPARGFRVRPKPLPEPVARFAQPAERGSNNSAHGRACQPIDQDSGRIAPHRRRLAQGAFRRRLGTLTRVRFRESYR